MLLPLLKCDRWNTANQLYCIELQYFCYLRVPPPFVLQSEKLKTNFFFNDLAYIAYVLLHLVLPFVLKIGFLLVLSFFPLFPNYCYCYTLSSVEWWTYFVQFWYIRFSAFFRVKSFVNIKSLDFNFCASLSLSI